MLQHTVKISLLLLHVLVQLDHPQGALALLVERILKLSKMHGTKIKKNYYALFQSNITLVM